MGAIHLRWEGLPLSLDSFNADSVDRQGAPRKRRRSQIHLHTGRIRAEADRAHGTVRSFD